MTSLIPVAVPWSIEEWTRSKLSDFEDDWRFYAFLDAWKAQLFKSEKAEFYISLILLPEKHIPNSLQEIIDHRPRFEAILKRSYKRVISEQELHRILSNVENIAIKQKHLLPHTASKFECLTIALDFISATAKRRKIKLPPEAKSLENALNSATIPWAIVAVNEHFGLDEQQRKYLPRGRLPQPPGRRGFSHHCPQCKKTTTQKVLYSYVNLLIEPEIPTEYTLSECSRCHGPGLFMREDEGYGFLPKSEFHLWRGESRTNDGILPIEVAQHYLNAKRYEKEKLWDATVLEIGRTMEAVVKHFGGKHQSLGNGLRYLRDTNIITPDFYKGANELRIRRNLSAHATQKRFTEPEATDAFDFLDIIVENIFHIRFQVEKFNRSAAPPI